MDITKKMTFADKKIEEFRDKFCFIKTAIKENGKLVKNPYGYELKEQYSQELENWLKQTIAEAEREAYLDCSKNGGELPIEFHRFVDKKLKELELE